jgi:hypothetical protein
MTKCPNSSHSAGLNARKSRAAVTIKRQSVKLSSFHNGLLSMSYSFFLIPATQSILSVALISALVTQVATAPVQTLFWQILQYMSWSFHGIKTQYTFLQLTATLSCSNQMTSVDLENLISLSAEEYFTELLQDYFQNAIYSQQTLRIK